MVTKNKENKRTRVPSPPPRHVSPERVPPQRLRQSRTPTQSRSPRLSIPPQPLARLLNLARAPPLIHRLERRRRRGGERPDDAERPASRARAHPRLNRLVEPAPKRAPSLAGSFADSQTSRLGGELAVRRRERAIVLEHAQVPGDGGRVRERARSRFRHVDGGRFRRRPRGEMQGAIGSRRRAQLTDVLFTPLETRPHGR